MAKSKKAPIYHARKLRGLSQEELGKKLRGIDKSSVSRYENYISTPETEIAVAMASFLGIPLGDVLEDYARNVRRTA